MASSDAQNDIVLRIGRVLNVQKHQRDRMGRVEQELIPTVVAFRSLGNPLLLRPWQPGALGTLQLCSRHGAGVDFPVRCPAFGERF